jgi:hypothetical protein
MSWSSGRLRYLTPRRLVFHTSVRRVARKAMTTIRARPYANGPPAPVPSHITDTPGHSRLSALESQHCRVPRVSHRGAPRPRTTRPRTRDRAVCHRGPLDTRYSFHADTAQEQSKRGPSPSACISAPRQRRGDFSAVAVCCVRKAQERRASIADPSDLRRRGGHDAARCSSSLAQSWTCARHRRTLSCGSWPREVAYGTHRPAVPSQEGACVTSNCRVRGRCPRRTPHRGTPGQSHPTDSPALWEVRRIGYSLPSLSVRA